MPPCSFKQQSPGAFRAAKSFLIIEPASHFAKFFVVLLNHRSHGFKIDVNAMVLITTQRIGDPSNRSAHWPRERQETFRRSNSRCPMTELEAASSSSCFLIASIGSSIAMGRE